MIHRLNSHRREKEGDLLKMTRMHSLLQEAFLSTSQRKRKKTNLLCKINKKKLNNELSMELKFRYSPDWQVSTPAGVRIFGSIFNKKSQCTPARQAPNLNIGRQTESTETPRGNGEGQSSN